jgi:hypothetical protein
VVQTLSGPADLDVARSAKGADVDVQLRDLLDRISAQERMAEDALPALEDFFGWPAWSMDTGLTPAQERFVEHWSPQRVIDDSRCLRRLVGVLQGLTSTHRGDLGLDEVLSAFAAAQAR